MTNKHWHELPLETAEHVKPMIQAFLEDFPSAEYGHAHAVLSDYNLEDYFIASALADLALEICRDGCSKDRVATVQILHKLLTLDEQKRTAWYD